MWAIQTKNNTYVRHEYTDEDMKVLLFKTRKRAQAWLDDNHFWQVRAAKVVKVTVRIASGL
jgi:hypothetical protein